MFQALNQSTFKSLAAQHRYVVAFQEMPGDCITPIQAFSYLNPHVSTLTLLESSPNESPSNRFSYLCFDPVVTFRHQDGKTHVIDEESEQIFEDGSPFEHLRALKKSFDVGVAHQLSGLCGGCIGLLSYDAIRLIETLPDQHVTDVSVPDIIFHFHRYHVVFDHHRGRVVLNGLIDTHQHHSMDQAYGQMMDHLNTYASALERAPSLSSFSQATGENEAVIAVDVTDEHFMHQVVLAKEAIKQGDAFQVVLSREFSVKTEAVPFDLYRALRYHNPSPYLFYVPVDHITVMGSSPEKLVRLHEGELETCPLAGTCARGEASDDDVISNLKADEKETAEHMMLVDLARNDLGRVAVPGSVHVPQLKEAALFQSVIHLASSIKARLQPGHDALDALQATLPAGTLSGAPKIKAMQLIDQLETQRRGFYGGTLCAIDYQGQLESCIVIRTIQLEGGVARVRAGAGIVHDSSPQAEADETRKKAQAVLEAILSVKGDAS